MAESALVRTVKAKKKPVSMFSARVEFCAEVDDLNLVLESELGQIICVFLYIM